MKSTTIIAPMQGADTERELLRKARVARFRRDMWCDFWRREREGIFAAFPDRRQRARLVDALQQIVLTGIGEPVEELPE
jgi:hypothetical protein